LVIAPRIEVSGGLAQPGSGLTPPVGERRLGDDPPAVMAVPGGERAQLPLARRGCPLPRGPGARPARPDRLGPTEQAPPPPPAPTARHRHRRPPPPPPAAAPRARPPPPPPLTPRRTQAPRQATATSPGMAARRRPAGSAALRLPCSSAATPARGLRQAAQASP